MTQTPDKLIALPSGTKINHYKELGSTNTQAFILCQQGLTLPLWVSARHQTSGRGRGGNSWQSLPGNALASYVFEVGCEPQSIPQLAFVAGLAVRDTVRHFLSEKPEAKELVALKWPNDVLCSGEKIAGVLVQTMQTKQPTKTIAVIGIGLNIAENPSGLDQPTTCLRKINGAAAKLPTPHEAIENLDQTISGWLLRWREGAGWSDIRTNWVAQTGLFGHRVVVRSGDINFSGVMKGLDETGALLILTDDDGQKRVTFGDIALI